MSPKPDPTADTPLARLLEASAPRTTAAQVVERLRLWDPDARPAPAQPASVEDRPAPASAPIEDRPRVFLNMVCTADGRATLAGRSGPIGNRADRELFHALRTAVDAVLVGAGTVRAERYGRLVKDPAGRRLRGERGLSEEPLACIVSASLDLSPETVPLLGDPDARVLAITPSPAGELPAGGAPVEYVRAARAGALDLHAALADLRRRWGVRTVLCEGGPHLNGALLAAGVVDELFLSLAPKLGGGDPRSSPRIVSGPELDPPVALELRDALESEGCLLLRYRVSG